jgi:hypothetical protein
MAVIPKTLADLTPAQLDEAIVAFTSDYVPVVKHVLRETRVYPPELPATKRLRATWERREIAEPHPTLAKVLGWVLFMMQHWEKYRRLTAEERAIRAAARRLSDALYYDEP